jgi:DNA-binding SARP family transcriptional activator/streptogramin lyase
MQARSYEREVGVEVRILGPLEVWADGTQIDLGSNRQRALLALLVLHAGEVVSTDRLIDELWAGNPPPTAAKVLQNLVSQLRRALGAELGQAIVTRPPGYELLLEDDALDARRFERLAAEGRRELDADPAGAAGRFREALALWRGEPLAEFAYDEFARPEIARLDELRLAALEDRIDADLAVGRHAELVPELATLVAAHPLRERLRGQQMLALYRSGRQADALDAYRSARLALQEELGLEPSRSLRELEQAILVQDPALGEPSRPPAPPARRRRRRLLVAAAGASALALGVALGVAFRGGGSGVTVLPESVVAIDPASDEIVDSIVVGAEPGQVRVLGDGVYVTSVVDKTLTRIDVRSGEVATSGEHAAGLGVAAAGDQLWVASETRSELTRVNPRSLGAIERIRLAGTPPGSLRHALPVLGAGSLWVSEFGPSAVSRWSLRTHRLIRRYELSMLALPVEITFGDGAAWVALHEDGELLRIDAASGSARSIAVGPGPTNPAVGFGSVWVGSTEQGTVWRVDSLTERVQRVIEVGGVPHGLAVGAGSVWVSDYCRGTVVRIDPESNEVVARIETGHIPRWLEFGAGGVWVGVTEADVFEFLPTEQCRSSPRR